MTASVGNGCLILACGNPLRGDDGAAVRLAEKLQQTPLPEGVCVPSGVRIIVQQQWTPELAEEIASATAVLFLDCALTQPPGAITLTPVAPASALHSALTHHQDPASLLAIAQSIYDRVPAHCDLLLIGAQSIEHGDLLSAAVEAALPKALDMLRAWIHLHCPKHFAR